MRERNYVGRLAEVIREEGDASGPVSEGGRDGGRVGESE